MLELLQRHEPQKTTGWLLLGSAKSRLGDTEGALIAYNAALAIDKENIAALVNGGTCLRDLGQPEAALSRLLRACKLAPNVPEAIYNVGDIYLALEQFDAAENAASVAIKISPSMPAAHVLRVVALEGALRYEEALRAAQRGLSQNPSNFGLQYEVARMLRLVGKLADAETAFKKCTSPRLYDHSEGVRPSSIAYAHNEYAALLSQLGRNEDARKHWRKSVEVDPTFAQGWVNAASHEDGLEQSLAMYQRAVALSPGLVEGWINIGQVCCKPARCSARVLLHSCSPGRSTTTASERTRATCGGRWTRLSGRALWRRSLRRRSTAWRGAGWTCAGGTGARRSSRRWLRPGWLADK